MQCQSIILPELLEVLEQMYCNKHRHL